MKDVLFFTSSSRYSCRDRLDGIYRFARGRGWRVQIIERAQMKASVRALLGLWRPIGVIAECGHVFPEITPKVLGQTPLVYLSEDPALGKGRGCFVNTDEQAIGALAAKELISLLPASFAFVGFPGGRYWSDGRLAAYRATVEMHGGTCRVFDSANRLKGAARRKALIEWLRTLPKPCGLFAAHDPVAEEVLSAAADAGLRLPDELAVIGVDDNVDICERTEPTLTSIRIDFEQAGYNCAKLLAERLANPRLKTRFETIPPLYVAHRQSTRKTALSDGKVLAALEFVRRESGPDFHAMSVARFMGCSRRSAELRFRRQTGKTIHETVNEVRLERAKAMLADRSRPIESIAGELGWQSRAAFRTAFKRAFGQTPRDWRMGRNSR